MSDDDFDEFGGFEAAEALDDVSSTQQQSSEAASFLSLSSTSQPQEETFLIDNKAVDTDNTTNQSAPWSAFASPVEPSVASGTNGNLPVEQLEANFSAPQQQQPVVNTWTLMAASTLLPGDTTVSHQSSEQTNCQENLGGDKSHMNQQENTHSAEMKEELSGMEKKLSTTEKEKYRLTLELQAVNEKLEKLAADLNQSKAEVDERKKEYKAVQERHGEELESLRQANHTALAVIVEEYKELCKTAVTEQQDVCNRKIQETISAETVKSQNLLENQASRFDEWQVECEKKYEEKIRVTTESLAEEFKSEFEKEKVSLSAKVESEVEKVRKSQHVLKDELMESVQVRLAESCKLLEEKCTELTDLKAADMEKKLENSLKDAVNIERESCMEFWKKQSGENKIELQKGIEEAVENTKQSMEKYVSDRVKADQTSQQRHLSAIDLFLDSARQHISTLQKSHTNSQTPEDNH